LGTISKAFMIILLLERLAHSPRVHFSCAHGLVGFVDGIGKQHMVLAWTLMSSNHEVYILLFHGVLAWSKP
jgi:hypothetical protein